jgi:serine phosphatase RsbU (regulator of sigma subunit)
VSETLQLSMLPGVTGTTEVAARYVPAGGSLAVGGDWYDVVRLDDDRLALLVGDCVGHGLHAATVMGQLRSASRALLLEHHGAAATLEALDRFARTIDGAECTTVFCGIVDPRAGTLTYSSAGHPPPLVLGHGEVSWLGGATGVPLAVPFDSGREEATVTLDPTDTLVLYTDGLVERRDDSIDAGLRALADAALALGPRLRIELLADVLIE